MLTGINPGLSPFRFDPLRTHCAEISPELETVIARCRELDQDRRPQHISEVRDALLGFAYSLVALALLALLLVAAVLLSR